MGFWSWTIANVPNICPASNFYFSKDFGVSILKVLVLSCRIVRRRRFFTGERIVSISKTNLRYGIPVGIRPFIPNPLDLMPCEFCNPQAYKFYAQDGQFSYDYAFSKLTKRVYVGAGAQQPRRFLNAGGLIVCSSDHSGVNSYDTRPDSPLCL